MDNFLVGLKAFLCNYLFISAVVSWLVAQVIKIFTNSLRTKRRNNVATFIFSTGGMPSSHSATMMGLTTAAAIHNGFESSTFAICAILSIVVMTDAFGVRYETGKQAKMLNNLLKKETENNPDFQNEAQIDENDKSDKKTKNGKNNKKHLTFNEFVGHTPFQVLIGALVGVVVGITLSFVF